jgi:hypothetical protein
VGVGTTATDADVVRVLASSADADVVRVVALVVGAHWATVGVFATTDFKFSPDAAACRITHIDACAVVDSSEAVIMVALGISPGAVDVVALRICPSGVQVITNGCGRGGVRVRVDHHVLIDAECPSGIQTATVVPAAGNKPRMSGKLNVVEPSPAP